MFRSTIQNDRNICIICLEKRGTIRTLDGMVCEDCMPTELIAGVQKLRKHNILSYQRTHTSWNSCSNNSILGECQNRIIEDRSAAITQETPTILADELNAQIQTAESIDIIVSFIMLSGLSLIQDSLMDFTKKGRLRVITTSYMGITEYVALNELFRLPNTEVRMELSVDRTRLHAKSFIFRRSEGKSTAFVGSANISKSALTEGEEWVVKLREQDVPQVIEDLQRSYDELWNSSAIKPVTKKNRAEIETALENLGK